MHLWSLRTLAFPQLFSCSLQRRQKNEKYIQMSPQPESTVEINNTKVR
jgi:hypothetical protein